MASGPIRGIAIILGKSTTIFRTVKCDLGSGNLTDGNKVKITVSKEDFDKIKAKLEAGKEKSRKLVGIKIEIACTERKLGSFEGTFLLRLESV
jgi:hypothetical protein